MIFSTLLLLFPFSLAVDVWTPFLNEEGLEYDASEFEGLELSKFGSNRGGNGGGKFTDDCETKGGLKMISMQCGKYVGSFRLQCKNKSWLAKRGLGKSNGAGRTQNLAGDGIRKVVIRAGAYVDRITFYKKGKAVKTCGKSGGGRRYTAVAPRGMQLCGLKGRAGWWMDGIAAGWCRLNISFKLFKSGKSWTQAKDDCARRGGRLAKIRTKAENNKVRAVVGRNQAWIGVNDISSEGKFRNIDGTPLEYTQWQPGEPNNSGNEDCVEMYGQHGGNWNDLPCGHGRYYVCEFGFRKNKKVGEKHFQFFRISKNWSQARQYCQKRGGDLAQIDNASENAQVDSIIERFHAYIGVNDRAREKKFTNANGTPAKYFNWYPGEPNNVGNGKIGEDCVEIYGEHGGKWNDLPCHHGRYFVCQFVKGIKPRKTPARPKTPGCYVFTPTGCPNQKFDAHRWTRDTWGEANRNAGASRSRCLSTRKREFDRWCGAKNTVMHFNPLARPRAGGCYVLTPSGCPKQKQFNARLWTRDGWGEMHRNARYNTNQCLSTRKREYDNWCGAKDTMMVWNFTAYPKKPTAPGCYVFTPTGCPKQKFNARSYVRDTWGEVHRNAGSSRSRCLATRRGEYNRWCGSSDAQMHFVPLRNPTKPGCWNLTPTGCPKQKYNARVWTKDIWGETHRNARYNRNACLRTRTGEYNRWCKAKDTKMFFVPTPMPARPRKPGCYVFTPTGCPNQKWNSGGKFVLDTWGIVNRNAGASSSRCLITRKNEFNRWCKAGDTQMHYVPFARPKTPGCYVLTPTGCKNQKFNARVWTRDTWGEANRHARYNRGACLSTRKREFDRWCGASDTLMHWNKSPFPPRPNKPGCYVFSPSGCPKQKWNSAGKFVQDSWGEVNRNAAASRSQCLSTRKREFDRWCNAKDTYMHWVKPANPTTAGCYVLTPSGCPKQKYNARVWTRDTWGEQHRNARYDRNACLKTRTNDFNGWCGGPKNTQMFWKASPMPKRPTKPGCYVYTPTGCPKQPFKATSFVRDTWGEKNRNAYKDRNACLATRKRDYNSWCGAGDTQMVWNPPPKECCAWFYQHCWYNSRPQDRNGWKFRSCKNSKWIDDGANGRGGKNNHLSSVIVSTGCKLTLFEHPRWKGRRITLTGKTKCLVEKHMTAMRTWNDVVSSWEFKRAASFSLEAMTGEELDAMDNEFASEQDTEFGSESNTIVYGAFALCGMGIVGVGVYLFRKRQQHNYEQILS